MCCCVTDPDACRAAAPGRLNEDHTPLSAAGGRLALPLGLSERHIRLANTCGLLTGVQCGLLPNARSLLARANRWLADRGVRLAETCRLLA